MTFTANSYLGTAAHANTWRLRGTLCAHATRHGGVTAAPNRSKVIATPPARGH